MALPDCETVIAFASPDGASTVITPPVAGLAVTEDVIVDAIAAGTADSEKNAARTEIAARPTDCRRILEPSIPPRSFIPRAPHLPPAPRPAVMVPAGAQPPASDRLLHRLL